jgi:hypothetical protein
MQFITNGPDIPDTLLHAHEEGRVVFFCGAGISYPAGLPDFKGLVEKIYQECGDTFNDIEKEAFELEQFDATLNLLERRLRGNRLTVRRALAKALKPNLRSKGATDTQEALLRLASARDGSLRMVTTNFDQLFDKAAKRTGQTFQSYVAPMLPIPKNSHWNGLVYLHGVLPKKEDDTSLNRLVVTSGDFGLAYLTERWAARFVSELFRNYVVCFVGYSINDPVLRYMMDALAADRMLGEVTPQAWALGDCESGEEHRKTIEWEAKGVRPILYEVSTGRADHSALHKTLQAWAETYRDGVQGKESIVVKHGLTQPQASTQQDDFVGRMLWALSEKSGLPAKCFADLNPAPSLDWLLESFNHERFEYNDLERFCVPSRADVDKELRFSLVRRPAPYDRAPRMLLVSGGISGSQWDKVMFHLARWLTRHLNDPRLVIWIAESGGQLDDAWRRLIESELDSFSKLEQEGNTAKLDEIRSQAPMAMPSPFMKTLWRLLLSGRVKSLGMYLGLHSWKTRLQREGLTTLMRLELRELLSPKVALKKPFRWADDGSSSDNEPPSIKQLVDWDLVLAADDVHSALDNIAHPLWKSAQPLLLEDFQQLLRDALDLLREMGKANDQSDSSHWYLSSISPHWQNRGYYDWVSLIELLRDSWLALHAGDNDRGTSIAQAWFDFPYPTFKRLALFAASQDNCIQSEQWVEWLLSDGAWVLWSIETQREVYRLFVLKGRLLDGAAQTRLEAAILSGPSREMYRDGLEDELWQDLVDSSVWLHLAKLNSSGLTLGKHATKRLAEISNAFPEFQLAENESDEFSHWMTGTGDPDYKDSQDVDIAPRKRQALVQWLTKPERHPAYEDTWRDVCRTRFFHSLGALCDLAKRGEWPTKRWQEALQTWAEDDLVSRAWRYAAPLVETMPDNVIQEIVHNVSWWMREAAKGIDRHEDILLKLCQRVLALDINAETGITQNGQPLNQPVTDAINHPVGIVTQALIDLWLKQNPNDNDLLPANIKSSFTSLFDLRKERFRHGRVLLASRLITLFRVDLNWTEENLLPLFKWDNPKESKAVWEGFLLSPRLYQPLLTAIKEQLLATVNHYNHLGEHRQQFATFLTYVALGPTDGYTSNEFHKAIGLLPQDGLDECARALSQALTGAGEQREDYWKYRVRPFWQEIWPKSDDLVTPRTVESLARLAIAARGKFPDALTAVHNWLEPLDHPSYLVGLLNESGLCSKFPKDANFLLSKLIDNPQWTHREELDQCLNNISQANSQLLQDTQYKRLLDYCRSGSG